MVLAGFLLIAAFAQAPDKEVACWAERPAPPSHIQIQGGYTLTFGAARGADSAAVEFGCSVEVRNQSGRVVYRSDGFNTRLHRASGRDVDNDGHPDLILGTDTGGGNRCCWRYAVLSLTPAPHVIAKFDNPSFTSDDNGRTVIWTTQAFYGLQGATMAESPAIVAAHQFRNGRVVEVTLEFCDAMLAGRSRGWGDLKPELEMLTEQRKADSRSAGAKGTDEVEETRRASLAWSLQALYCGRRADAARVIGEVWPAARQADVLAGLTSAIAHIK